MQESEIKRFSDFQGIEKPMEGKSTLEKPKI